MSAQQSQRAVIRSFFKTFILPTLFVLVLPTLSLAFSDYQLDRWSDAMRQNVRDLVAQQRLSGTNFTEDQLKDIELNVKRIDISDIATQQCGPVGFLAEPEGLDATVCSSVLQFVWGERLSLALLLWSALSFLIVFAALLWALKRPRAQHRAFTLGWQTLKIFGVPHILGQSALLVFLSFWVTAIFLGVYSLKLIVLAGFVALSASFFAIRALFQRKESAWVEHGLLLDPHDAPALFEHMTQLAQSLKTEPPSCVVVGIHDNFFVAEQSFHIFERYGSAADAARSMVDVEGRALYVSLPLMRTLSKEELSAVLAHELGHFAAGDTSLSRELNTRFKRFDAYLSNLTVTLGVASCLIAFRALFELISRRHSRTAEFAADAAAASVTSAEAMSRALLKIAAYSTYRSHTEAQLFDGMEANPSLNISQRVDEGFSPFMASRAGQQALFSQAVPHPFDSHPPLLDRIERLGVEPLHDEALAALAKPPVRSWYEAIEEASALEARLWDAYEQKFQAEHDFAIALRLMPQTEAEIAHVERYFPSARCQAKAGHVFVLDWRHVRLEGEWSLCFDEIVKVERKETTLGKAILVLESADQKHKISLSSFDDGGQRFIQLFQERWRRNQIAANYMSTAAKAEPAAEPSAAAAGEEDAVL